MRQIFGSLIIVAGSLLSLWGVFACLLSFWLGSGWPVSDSLGEALEIYGMAFIAGIILHVVGNKICDFEPHPEENKQQETTDKQENGIKTYFCNFIMTIGFVLALGSGLCSLAFLLGGGPLSNRGSSNMLFLIFTVGGLTFAIGTVLFLIGKWMKK